MKKGRMEAFSDGVIAIIITIMVLELKVPHESTFLALVNLYPVFLSYVLSFVYVAIYWNNHHHLLHAAERVTAPILWANMHLLFWLSLIPFVTGWMGENHFEPIPTMAYGFVLFMCSIAYWVLQQAIVVEHGRGATLAKAIGKDFKGKISPLLYIIGIAGTYFHDEWLGQLMYTLTAIMWLVPDRRIEKALDRTEQ